MEESISTKMELANMTFSNDEVHSWAIANNYMLPFTHGLRISAFTSTENIRTRLANRTSKIDEVRLRAFVSEFTHPFACRIENFHFPLY